MIPELGDRLRDKVTGFTGIAIGVTDWMSQCKRWIIQPESLHEGKPVEAQSFDETHIEIVDKHAFEPSPITAPLLATTAPPERSKGGPAPTPTRPATPGRRG
jgi:hypothetical protein